MGREIQQAGPNETREGIIEQLLEEDGPLLTLLEEEGPMQERRVVDLVTGEAGVDSELVYAAIWRLRERTRVAYGKDDQLHIVPG